MKNSVKLDEVITLNHNARCAYHWTSHGSGWIPEGEVLDYRDHFKMIPFKVFYSKHRRVDPEEHQEKLKILLQVIENEIPVGASMIAVCT